jgi:hypothetical protein
MEKDDLFYHLKLAEKVRYKQYRLMGIDDRELIRTFLDLDNLWFTHMWYHRKDIDDSIQSLRDEISTDELD